VNREAIATMLAAAERSIVTLLLFTTGVVIGHVIIAVLW
jgi:uncharacterized membrane protein YciS (DUF1049 family)